MEPFEWLVWHRHVGVMDHGLSLRMACVRVREAVLPDVLCTMGPTSPAFVSLVLCTAGHMDTCTSHKVGKRVA